MHSSHIQQDFKSSQTLQKAPIAEAGMLIRRPVEKVFEAFINPAITSKFWFTKGSERVEKGQEIQWDWEMYGRSVHVRVLDVDPNKRILMEWRAYVAPTQIELLFTSPAPGETFVNVVNSGFQGTGDEVVKQVLDSTGGFVLVLAGAKAFLEHNIGLNLIADRFPDKVIKK